MKLSILLKSILSRAIFYSGVASGVFAKKNNAGDFLILMYHRVTLPDETIQPGMYVTPGTFNQHLQFLSKSFTVISLQELLTILINKKECSFEKPVCVITFDDGWLDFYDNAFPLLCKFNMPATVFLPTGYIGSDDKFWTDIFASLLLRKNYISPDASTDSRLTDSGFLDIIDQLNSLHGDYENKLEQGIAILKALPKVTILKLLNELSGLWGVTEIFSERDFISWPEVEEMKATKLISFGSHTVSHEILTTITEKEILSELVDSKNELLEKGAMDNSCLSFCYPNGGFTSKITEMVRDAGYQIAVTTRHGWNQNSENIVALNRVGIHQDMASSIPLFASRLAGFI